ncbi:AEC family transporter [Francisella halioticida]|uniref:AEC family transporter n=1 Tax=Francisella halioticida TaxID=549298 RepID=UPI0021012801|nr:AEC family transporter [Francisella halioticida]
MLPIFIIIFFGWLTGYLKLVGENAHKTCAKIVTVYVFPALLFMQTATARPEQIFDISWMSAFLISIAIIWTICFSASILIFKESKKNSVMQAMINTFTDMGGMGIPFFISIIGSTALISVAKANFVISLTLIPLTIFLLELYSRSTQSKKVIILYALSKSLKKTYVLSYCFRSNH